MKKSSDNKNLLFTTRAIYQKEEIRTNRKLKLYEEVNFHDGRVE